MRTFYYLIVILPLLTGTAAIGQEQISGDLYAHLTGVIGTIPGSSGNEYANPTTTELEKWEAMVEAIFEGEYPTGQELAEEIGYRLIAFTDTSGEAEQSYYLLEKATASGNYWGTYVLNASECTSKLVLQSPHSVFDSNTGKQSAFIFSRIHARALCISGTHRCNSSVATDCSGSTAVCGTSQAYRISDVAHNTTGIFQLMTRLLNDQYPASVFVQLHGFAQDANDPDAILSNGSRISPGVDYITQLTGELSGIDPSLSFKIGHKDLDWNELLAFTNTQGRLINKSVDPCSVNATNTAGRFIHIEQAYTPLRANQSAWEKMLVAMANVFPCGEVITSTEAERQNSGLALFPNPAGNDLHMVTLRKGIASEAVIYTSTGECIGSYPFDGDIHLDTSGWKAGIYLIVVKERGKAIFSRRILKK